MAQTSRSSAKSISRTHAQGAKQPASGSRSSNRRNGPGHRVDPNSNAVPFDVTALAAAVFEPPAISDAIEETPLFDKSTAKRVSKRKQG